MNLNGNATKHLARLSLRARPTRSVSARMCPTRKARVVLPMLQRRTRQKRAAWALVASGAVRGHRKRPESKRVLKFNRAAFSPSAARFQTNKAKAGFMRSKILVLKIAVLVLFASINLVGAQQAWQTKKWAPHLIVSTSASGSTPDFCHSLTITVSSDFAGTIDGQTIAAGAVTQSFVWRGNVEHPLQPVAYTRTAGTLYIAFTQ
jgi:hypothetical protein